MSFRRTRITGEDVEEFGGGYHLHILRGRDVVDYDDASGSIRFSGSRNLTLQIESPDPLVTSDETTTQNLSGLQGMRVASATATSEGSLDVRFSGGLVLSVPSGPYEAWSLRADPTLNVISVAGGGVAIWL